MRTGFAITPADMKKSAKKTDLQVPPVRAKPALTVLLAAGIVAAAMSAPIVFFLWTAGLSSF